MSNIELNKYSSRIEDILGLLDRSLFDFDKKSIKEFLKAMNDRICTLKKIENKIKI